MSYITKKIKNINLNYLNKKQLIKEDNIYNLEIDKNSFIN